MSRHLGAHKTGPEGLDGILAPLPVGTYAPDFTLPQVVQPRPAYRPQSSSQLWVRGVGRGQAFVLVFYPMDWEPVSREQLMLYQGYTAAFSRLKAQMVGISTDHVYSHDAFASDAQLNFPLLADVQPRGKVARQYGVWRKVQGLCARALFVLDRKRVIRFSRAYPDQLNPGVDELLTTLETLVAEDETTGRR